MVIGVITNDVYKARKFFDSVMSNKEFAKGVKKYRFSHLRYYIEHENDMRYIWLRPVSEDRGWKLDFAFVDNAMSNEETKIALWLCYGCSDEKIQYI